MTTVKMAMAEESHTVSVDPPTTVEISRAYCQPKLSANCYSSLKGI